MILPVHPELGGIEFDYTEALDGLAIAMRGQHTAPAAKEIAQVVIQLGALLLKKNAAYGDSALHPVECFARGMSPVQRMGVRLDDKISRLSRGTPDDEDVHMDIAGYLVLLRIAAAQQQAAGAQTHRSAFKAAQQADIDTLNESIQRDEGRRAAYQARIAAEKDL